MGLVAELREAAGSVGGAGHEGQARRDDERIRAVGDHPTRPGDSAVNPEAAAILAAERRPRRIVRQRPRVLAPRQTQDAVAGDVEQRLMPSVCSARSLSGGTNAISAPAARVAATTRRSLASSRKVRPAPSGTTTTRGPVRPALGEG
jgi:hypothetical protein